MARKRKTPPLKSQNQESDINPGRILRNIVLVAILITVVVIVYILLDQRFREEQERINDEFAENSGFSSEEEAEQEVRDPHEFEDEFEGWDTLEIGNITIRHPSEYNANEGKLGLLGCQNSDAVKTIQSQSYIDNPGIVSSTNLPIGIDVCYFPNDQALSIVEFVTSDSTWLPDTEQFNNEDIRLKVKKNWVPASIVEEFAGYYYDGGDNSIVRSRIAFVQHRDLNEIYVLQLDLDSYYPDGEEIEDARKLFEIILSSVREKDD